MLKHPLLLHRAISSY